MDAGSPNELCSAWHRHQATVHTCLAFACLPLPQERANLAEQTLRQKEALLAEKERFQSDVQHFSQVRGEGEGAPAPGLESWGAAHKCTGQLCRLQPDAVLRWQILASCVRMCCAGLQPPAWAFVCGHRCYWSLAPALG